MRFRRWPRSEPYGDTPRKRAAFLRKQRREREALPLFADQIAASQHGVEEEMAAGPSGGTRRRSIVATSVPIVGVPLEPGCLHYRMNSGGKCERSGRPAPIPPTLPALPICFIRSVSASSILTGRPGHSIRSWLHGSRAIPRRSRKLSVGSGGGDRHLGTTCCSAAIWAPAFCS